MDPILIGIIGIVVLLVLLFAGVHVAVTLGLVGLFGGAAIVGFKTAALIAVDTIYYKACAWSLVTLPLFILMGYLAAGGGVSTKLYDALSLWLRKFKSGLGIATVLGCTGFGAVTGSSIVTSSVFAKIAAPEMRRHGYDKKLAYGICASSGIIGMMIPPSILAIVYGTLTGLSIGRLLVAGIGPGLMLAVIFSIGIVLIGKLRPEQIKTTAITGVTWRQRFAALPPTWPIIVVGVVIFGGIFTGVFSPSEAAAAATFIILIVVLVTRHSRIKESIVPALRDTASNTAMIFLLLCSAQVFASFLILTGLSGKAVALIIDLQLPTLAFMGMFVLLYLILGMVIDSISMFAITIPIVVPAINALGIDPIWFAMVAITSSQVGTITPPMGFCVYASKAVAEPDVSLGDIFRGSMPFLIMDAVVLVILLLAPAISIALPSLMLG